MTTTMPHRTISIWGFAILAAVFGFMTIKSGGEVLFVGGEGHEAAGHYVPFVLWFNFIAGFVYIVAGIGVWLMRPWSAWLSLLLAAATFVIFAAFGLHILNGGEYEMRTVVVLSLRSAVWVMIAAFAWYRFLRHNNQANNRSNIRQPSLL